MATLVPTRTPEPAITLEPTPNPMVVVALLPAPLYYLGSDDQIMRLEMDGATSIQITEETELVTDFNISSSKGIVAYISGNRLFCTDPYGGDPGCWQRRLLDQMSMAGSVQIHSPVFSPARVKIAFAMDGVCVVFAGGGELEVIQGDDLPGPGAGSYSPVAWSPDGTRLLMSYLFYTHGGRFVVKSLADDSLLHLGSSCCQPSWSLSARGLAENPTIASMGYYMQ